MFKHLYEIARHTPLHLIITPNGPQLRIIVTPKPGGTSDSSALAKPFSVAGTPEELDAEFPAALAQYTSAVNDVRKSLDLPLDALEAEKKKTAKKDEAKAERERRAKAEAEARSAAAKKAAETRAENAAKKKTEEEARKKARTEARAAKKNKTAALPGATEPLPSSPQPAAPSGTQTSRPFPTGAAAIAADTAATPRPGLPGKPECIKDYEQLKLVHGDKLTRRLFIKKAETGRRYEKLWPNWEKFVKEAGAQRDLPLAGVAQHAETLAEINTMAAGAASEPVNTVLASGTPEPIEISPDDRRHPVIPIIPVEETAEQALADQDLVDDASPRPHEGGGTHTDVYDESGEYLSSITTKPELGEHIGLTSQEYLLRVTNIVARPSGGLDVTVMPDPEETARRAEAVAERVRAQAAERTPTPEQTPAPAAAAEKPRYRVYDEAGELLTEYKWAPSIGEKLSSIAGRTHPYRVIGLDGHIVAARRILPTKNRIVADGTGELLGHTDEIYEIADQVAEVTDKEVRVVKVELDAYVVRAAKPRVKGPAAVLAETNAQE
jgi:PRTRC genetic system protein E